MYENTKNPSVEFTAHDRCDRCGSQAYTLYSQDAMELMFCLHHSKQHELALECSGWTASYDYDAIERLVTPSPVPA